MIGHYVMLLQGGISANPLQVLCGHQDTVTSVTICTELDMAVSGSKVTSVSSNAFLPFIALARVLLVTVCETSYLLFTELRNC